MTLVRAIRIPAVFALAFALAGAYSKHTVAQEIGVQSHYPPLLLEGAPPGGAHPVGGPAKAFVDLANKVLPSEIGFEFHVSGGIPPADEGRVAPPLVSLDAFDTLYEAVAAGRDEGGVNAAIDISINNGLSVGELFVAGLPFGMNPDEYMAYLYEGGGLELQQRIYDEVFDGNVVVLPVAITSAQGPGWFPQPLPVPDGDTTPGQAMAVLCSTPMIVRWAEPAGSVFREACRSVGVEPGFIGAGTRCENPTEACPSEGNPVVNEIDRLTFGGFAPGAIPHKMLLTGNIDAFEFNLPSADVQFGRLVLGNRNIRKIVEKAPYQYAGAWHQPLTYVEMVVNKDFWRSIPAERRRMVETAARSATLFSLTARLDRQGDAMAELAENGAIRRKWDSGLLAILRDATRTVLDRKARQHRQAGDKWYARVLESMRAYMDERQAYFDYASIDRGLERTRTTNE